MGSDACLERTKTDLDFSFVEKKFKTLAVDTSSEEAELKALQKLIFATLHGKPNVPLGEIDSLWPLARTCSGGRCKSTRDAHNATSTKAQIDELKRYLEECAGGCDNKWQSGDHRNPSCANNEPPGCPSPILKHLPLLDKKFHYTPGMQDAHSESGRRLFCLASRPEVRTAVDVFSANGDGSALMLGRAMAANPSEKKPVSKLFFGLEGGTVTWRTMQRNMKFARQSNGVLPLTPWGALLNTDRWEEFCSLINLDLFNFDAQGPSPGDFEGLKSDVVDFGKIIITKCKPRYLTSVYVDMHDYGSEIVHKWMLKTLHDTYQVLWEAPAHLCFPNGDVGQGSHNTAGAIMVRIK